MWCVYSLSTILLKLTWDFWKIVVLLGQVRDKGPLRNKMDLIFHFRVISTALIRLSYNWIRKLSTIIIVFLCQMWQFTLRQAEMDWVTRFYSANVCMGGSQWEENIGEKKLIIYASFIQIGCFGFKADNFLQFKLSGERVSFIHFLKVGSSFTYKTSNIYKCFC